MSSVTAMPKTAEHVEAVEFCRKNWGWQNPSADLINRAIMTRRFAKENARVGDIVASLGLLPRTRIDALAEQKRSAGDSKPLLDYIIDNDHESKKLPDHKASILAFKEQLQYFDSVFMNDLSVHDDMSDDAVLSAAENFKAVLMLIEGSVPVLVFSALNDEYTRFITEGRLEQLKNVFKVRYPDLLIAAGNSNQVLGILNGDRKGKASDKGRTIMHSALLGDSDNAKRKFAKIFDYVVRNKGTDIHINPDNISDTTEVYARFNTVLRPVPGELFLTEPEYQVLKQYLTAQSGAVENNAVLQEPSDGRFSYRIGNTEIDVRCSYIPTGQDTSFSDNQLYIRLRLFPGAVGVIELEKYGVSPAAYKHFVRAMRPESGMSLMVGPTGSGKSTTLFGMANEHVKMHGDGKSRISVEDPVERKIPKLNQIQISDAVKKKYENPFLHYLKHLVRFDPDFIILGEVRDSETVEAAGNYANTGHMVLGTLHANDTIVAVDRITNMLKVADLRRMIIDSIHYIFSQRLLPILCDHCKIIGDVEQDLLDDARNFAKKNGNNPDDIPTRAAFKNEAGCQHCDYTGITSKTPVNEVLEFTDEVRTLIFSDRADKTIQLRKHRALTLYQETLPLILKHSVSFQELFK